MPLAWSTTKPRSSQLSQSWRATSIELDQARRRSSSAGGQIGVADSGSPSSTATLQPGDPAGASPSEVIERREDARDMKRLGDVARPPGAEARSARWRRSTHPRAAKDPCGCRRADRFHAVASVQRAGRPTRHRARRAPPGAPSRGKGAPPAKPGARVTRHAASCQPWLARETRRCIARAGSSGRRANARCAAEARDMPCDSAWPIHCLLMRSHANMVQESQRGLSHEQAKRFAGARGRIDADRSGRYACCWGRPGWRGHERASRQMRHSSSRPRAASHCRKLAFPTMGLPGHQRSGLARPLSRHEFPVPIPTTLSAKKKSPTISSPTPRKSRRRSVVR